MISRAFGVKGERPKPNSRAQKKDHENNNTKSKSGIQEPPRTILSTDSKPGNVNEQITERTVAMLETGVMPWRNTIASFLLTLARY